MHTEMQVLYMDTTWRLRPSSCWKNHFLRANALMFDGGKQNIEYFVHVCIAYAYQIFITAVPLALSVVCGVECVHQGTRDQGDTKK